jgi:hypothetical protein
LSEKANRRIEQFINFFAACEDFRAKTNREATTGAVENLAATLETPSFPAQKRWLSGFQVIKLFVC